MSWLFQRVIKTFELFLFVVQNDILTGAFSDFL